MSYTALYRKFRPDTFSDVKGQDHIVTTLKNQIKSERVGHAYLFTGTRGTGKTTVAKILAKAVNCENPTDGNPCGVCDSCKNISDGISTNVIEIDAASNNGVDNIREIREEVAYRPTMGRYKVYIIDEVHMLSTGAFNALLKTLEEPPSYVIFILATTEVNKIPVTILSRCQRYDFRRISIDTITDRLKSLMNIEHAEVEDRALRYIARVADGSMRDALSLLDQCLAFYMDEKLTYDKALNVLGTVDTEVFSKMLRAVIASDVTASIQLLENIILEGKEITQFVNDFTWYMRNLLLVKTSDNLEDVLDISTENLNTLKEEGTMVELDTLMRFIRIMSELSGQLRYAAGKRILVEIALIKLCKPQMETDTTSVLERVRLLEEKLEAVASGANLSGGASAYQRGAESDGGVLGGTSDTQGSQAAQSVRQEQSADKKPLRPAPEDLKRLKKDWLVIAGMVSGGASRKILKDAKPKYNEREEEGRLYLEVKNAFDRDFLNKEELLSELGGIIERQIGKHIDIAFVLADVNKNDGLREITAEAVQEMVAIPIEEED